MDRRQFLKTLFLTTSYAFAPIALSKAAARPRTVRCPILMYHYVSLIPPDADRYRIDLTVEPELFEEHCAYLSNHGYTTINMSDLYDAMFNDGELPEKPIILTFDDGYADAPAIPTPIMMAYRQVGTFFVIPDKMGTLGHMTWEQAAWMLSVGMEIENHSATHPDLRNLGNDSLAIEIGGAADKIGEILNKRARFFCYPGGKFNSAVIRAVRGSNHQLAVTTQDGTVHYPSDPFRLRRVRIRGNTSIKSLEWLINRWV